MRGGPSAVPHRRGGGPGRHAANRAWKAGFPSSTNLERKCRQIFQDDTTRKAGFPSPPRLADGRCPAAETLTGIAFDSDDTLFGDPLVKTTGYEHQEGSERRKKRALSMQPEKLQA